jgi:hypothetical protein
VKDMDVISVCACRYPVSKATFVEEAVSSPSYVLGAFVTNQVGIVVLIYIHLVF